MTDSSVNGSDRPVVTFANQVSGLINREMEIEGYAAYLDWSEDSEPPEILVRGLIARALAESAPATRKALAQLLLSSSQHP